MYIFWIQIINEILTMLLDGLENCDTDECQARIILALTNAGMPGTVAALLKHAEQTTNAMEAEAAIKALRRVDRKYITSEVGLYMGEYRK